MLIDQFVTNFSNQEISVAVAEGGTEHNHIYLVADRGDNTHACLYLDEKKTQRLIEALQQGLYKIQAQDGNK